MKKRLCAVLLSALLLGSLCPVAAAENPILAPSGFCATGDGGTVIADLYHRALWLQEPGGALTRLAGQTTRKNARGVPTGGYRDGAALDAAFETPWAVAPYRDGWAITDAGNNAVRYYAGGQVYTLAGGGEPGPADSGGQRFHLPTGLAAGADGCLYVADTGNSLIRKIDAKGTVTTWAGGGEGCSDGALLEAKFFEPTGLCWLDGVLYVADSGNNRVCKLENGMVTTLAGGTADGFADGPAGEALFSYPQGVAAGGGAVYVADTGNGAVRRIADGAVTTLAGSGSLGGGLWPVSPRGLLLSGDTLTVGDIFARIMFPLPTGGTSGGEAPGAFADVPISAWCYDAVNLVLARGLMTGTGPNTFSPQEYITRGMAVTILARLWTEPLPDAVFRDAPADARYADTVTWAARQGILTGDPNGDFALDRPATRAELATLLYRGFAAQYPAPEGDLAAFPDGGKIPEWARWPLTWAVGAGLFAPGSALAPDRPATRAETAAILARFLAFSGR